MNETAPVTHSGSRLSFAVFVELPSHSGQRVVCKTTVQVFCTAPLNPSLFDHEQLLLLALERVRFQKSLPPVFNPNDPREKIKAIRAEFAAKAEVHRAAAQPRGPACGDTACAAGGHFSTVPDGNNGDNLTHLTGKAVL